NVKLGLNNLTDIQFVISSLETELIKSSLGKQKSTQFGGITVRVKRNIWGNDAGKTALAIMPFINVPVRKDESKITGGLIVPFSLSLANDWGFGAQIQTDFIENQNSSGYHLNYLASATLAHPLFKKFDFFVESYITQETEINLFEYFFNTGLVYELGEHFKLDGGINYGIKQSSSKVYFIGLSFRY
ncbi:MAG: transporter, partial [Pelobium sp.]